MVGPAHRAITADKKDGKEEDHEDRPSQLREVDLVGGLENQPRQQHGQHELWGDLELMSWGDRRDAQSEQHQGDCVGELYAPGDERHDNGRPDERDEQLDGAERRLASHTR